MDTVIPGLYASEPESLGFGPSLGIRAFLLQRERGNLLVYRSEALERDVEALNNIGGIWRQYLNHHHEASPACDWVANTFDAPLHVHEEDAAAAAEICNVGATFSERHKLDEDFEVIPIPGHTSGATAFLWDSGQHRVLFTGDTIFFGRSKWRAAVLDGVSDREQYIDSLKLLRSLDFDLIVPGIAAAGRPYYSITDRAETTQQIDAILERLRRGEDG
ncbi:MAG: MBL fold metallo-hydrolase [Rubrobacteraceae bacterium]|nr:MBL fold metallo-hydrolase [Rubrobacteraceae bacterium]